MDIFVIAPNKEMSGHLKDMVHFASKGMNTIIIDAAETNIDLRNKRIIFASELNAAGFDISMLNFLSKLYEMGSGCLTGSFGSVLVHSSSELGTKSIAREIIFHANSLGCEFIGHPLVEATSSLSNFFTWQKVLPELTLEQICLQKCQNLGERLMNYKPNYVNNPSVTVLYSSPHKTSNTIDLWRMVSNGLKEWKINEFQIENGNIQDCKGCSFKLCKHYGEQNSCFYGGVMVESVLPSIEKADVVIWLCPNYNDAVAANLTAAINRLTVLYHKMNFYNISLFGVVVSGNSGSDLIAKQLICALNINKGFRLPPNAFLMATANDPGAIYNYDNIEQISNIFAHNIIKSVKGISY